MLYTWIYLRACLLTVYIQATIPFIHCKFTIFFYLTLAMIVTSSD